MCPPPLGTLYSSPEGHVSAPPPTDTFRRLAKSQPEYEEQDNVFSLKETTLWWKSINFDSASPISLLTTCSFWGKLLCGKKCCRKQQGNHPFILPYTKGYERTKAAHGSFLWVVIVQAGSSRPLSTSQPLAHPSSPPRQDGEEKWTKGKAHGLR